MVGDAPRVGKRTAKATNTGGNSVGSVVSVLPPSSCDLNALHIVVLGKKNVDVGFVRPTCT